MGFAMLAFEILGTFTGGDLGPVLGVGPHLQSMGQWWKKGAGGQCATWNPQISMASQRQRHQCGAPQAVRPVGAFHSTSSMVLSLDMSMFASGHERPEWDIWYKITVSSWQHIEKMPLFRASHVSLPDAGAAGRASQSPRAIFPRPRELQPAIHGFTPERTCMSFCLRKNTHTHIYIYICTVYLHVHIHTHTWNVYIYINNTFRQKNTHYIRFQWTKNVCVFTNQPWKNQGMKGKGDNLRAVGIDWVVQCSPSASSMSMYVYVFKYKYIYIYIYICTYLNIYIYVYVEISICYRKIIYELCINHFP